MVASNSPSIDLTTLFKSCVKTIRTRNKAIGISYPPTKILTPPPISQFFSRARDIQANISSHNNLLIEHKKKYLVDSDSLSSFERSYMDKVIAKNLKIIEDNLRNLESDAKQEKELSEHAKECQQNVINILRSNFLKTSAFFRDMKEKRLLIEKEKERLFRLSPKSNSEKKNKEERKTSHNDKTVDTLIENGINMENVDPDRLKESEIIPYQSTFESEVQSQLGSLSEEEQQILEEENTHLYQDLMSNHEEVKVITRQVVELSKMQDLFTENVELQTQQIDEIYETMIASTDNVQRGNEEVRQAMRKDAGFRIWIMFFLIVMSLTILFLDWYNP